MSTKKTILDEAMEFLEQEWYTGGAEEAAAELEALKAERDALRDMLKRVHYRIQGHNNFCSEKNCAVKRLLKGEQA